MMRKALFVIALLTLTLSSGATKPRVKHYTLPNAAFFFANNGMLGSGDTGEVIQSVAQMLCAQDRMSGASPGTWRASSCNDSRQNADAESISNDGAWRLYEAAARDVITQMCQGNSARLCESFK